MSEPNFEPQRETIPYASPQSARPGIITAVGVCSIVFGSLGALASLCGVVGAVANFFISHIVPPVGTATSASISAGGFSSYSMTISPSPAATATRPATLPTMFPRFHLSTAAVTLSFIGQALSLAIAIYLICAGASVMRNRLSALSMHWRYVWMKFVVVAIATAGTFWLQQEMMQRLSFVPTAGPSAFSGSFLTWAAVIQAVISAVFSLAYPIALIIVLSNNTVKTYFIGQR